MKMVALGSEGITSIGDYFANIYSYNVAQRQLGTFWDWGAELAMFGAALIAGRLRAPPPPPAGAWRR